MTKVKIITSPTHGNTEIINLTYSIVMVFLLTYAMFHTFNVSIFKSTATVPNNLFSFHVPNDLFTSEDSRRVEI